MKSTDKEIIRKPYLAEKIVIVDGVPGCGKTLFSPIISALDRVEVLSYTYEIEHMCHLYNLGKIDLDAAISMVRLLSDLKLYNLMMSRDTNFRPSDISSIFRSTGKMDYIKRLFKKGDERIPDRVAVEKPILNLCTHNLLCISKPVFSALKERLVFIEIVRHPLYMIIQQALNMERLVGDVRDFIMYYKYKDTELPHWALGWEDLFMKSNNVEKAIYSIKYWIEHTEKTKVELRDSKASLITIPFENFVLNPWSYMTKIEKALDSRIIGKTHKMMKKQNVPREKVSDGIPLAIYKRCGWEPTEKDLTEEQELEKRRHFAVDQGASKEAMEALDTMCENYEATYARYDLNS